MAQGLDRVDSPAEDGGDFGDGEPGDHTEQQDFALVEGELLEGGHDVSLLEGLHGKRLSPIRVGRQFVLEGEAGQHLPLSR